MSCIRPLMSLSVHEGNHATEINENLTREPLEKKTITKLWLGWNKMRNLHSLNLTDQELEVSTDLFLW